MFIRTIMLTAAITFISGAPLLFQQALADTSAAARSNDFKYISKDVKYIQHKLLNAGYSTGDIDGIFGPETSRAISQYQKENNLPQTGFPDNQFLRHLNKKPPTKPE